MSDKSIQIANVAEEVIKRFKDDPFERVRVLYGMELRPFQWEWWFLMDQYPDIVANACMRVGKTVVIQLKNLDEKLLNPMDEEMIFAPKYDQAVNTFRVQYDVIDRSPILKAFIRKNATGKPLFGQGFVEFYNGSKTKCFGVNSNFEGENATLQHVDELDDIPQDTLKRVKGRATAKNKNGMPTRHRLSGVIWGKLNIWEHENNPNYFVLPKVDVYLGLAAGYLDRKAVEDQRRQMTEEEWLRTQCLIYVEARNFIWSSKLHLSQLYGLKFGLIPHSPVKGLKFERKEGDRIAFGLDMGHQGAGEDASEYSLQVTMQRGAFRRWLWGRTWPPETDPDELISDVCEAWAYFMPAGGYGDSLDANLIARINDELYRLGLVRYNWRILGKNYQEGWDEWARHGLLTPLQNSGRTKHYFYMSLKQCFDNVSQIENGLTGRVMILPQIDRKKARELPAWANLQHLVRELENLQAERTASGYLKISRISRRIRDEELQFFENSKLGDDNADAFAMSNYYLDYLESSRRVGAVAVDYIYGI